MAILLWDISYCYGLQATMLVVTDMAYKLHNVTVTGYKL